MHKFTASIIMATIVAVFMTSNVSAEAAPYVREVAAYTGGTNTYSFGRWAAMNVFQVDVEDAIPTNATFMVVMNYGDTAGGTRTLGTIACTNGVGTLMLAEASWAYTLPDDAFTIRDNYASDTNAVTGTNYVIRLHGFIRNRKPLN